MDDACINVSASVSAAEFSLTVKRNCSIAPRTLLWLLFATVLLSFGIATGFALLGAWLVLPFAGLEMVALAVALYVNGRHACDYERFQRIGSALIVEVSEAELVSTHRFEAGRVRVWTSEAGSELRVVLIERELELEVGRHLDAPGRRGLVALLRAGLTGRMAG